MELCCRGVGGGEGRSAPEAGGYRTAPQGSEHDPELLELEEHLDTALWTTRGVPREILALLSTAGLQWKSSCNTFLFKHLRLLQPALLFSAFFHTAKQIRNSVIEAISIQQRYTKPKKENPTSQHSALQGNG